MPAHFIGFYRSAMLNHHRDRIKGQGSVFTPIRVFQAQKVLVPFHKVPFQVFCGNKTGVVYETGAG